MIHLSDNVSDRPTIDRPHWQEEAGTRYEYTLLPVVKVHCTYFLFDSTDLGKVRRAPTTTYTTVLFLKRAGSSVTL